MRKLTLIFICFVSVLNISAEIYSGSCGDNARYSLDTTTRVLSITGTGAMSNYSSYKYVPWYSNGFYIKTVDIADGITSIGNYAFYGCSGLKSVTIPNSVTSIGDDTFNGCSALTSVTIPNSVTSIGGRAFYGCSALIKVELKSNAIVSKSYSSYYSYSSLNDIFGSQVNEYILGDDVISIGDHAFRNCSNLTSVTIPNSVTSIEDYAFSGCSSLTSVTIPNSVTYIGDHAFFGCSGLTSVTIPNIPNSIISIGESAFYNCSGLTSIEIPNSVTYIKERTFAGCSGLTSIEIPNSVTLIGNNAFERCSNLTSVEIPNSVKSIGESIFASCSSLIDVSIGSNVTSIGGDSFNGCTNLKMVVLNSNEIASKAYSSDSSIKEIFGSQVEEYVIGDSVMSIGDDAFNGCKTVTSISIGSNIQTIGEHAFANIDKLNKFTCYSELVPTTARTTFDNSYINYVELYVPSASVNAYKNKLPWSGFGTINTLSGLTQCATPTIDYVNGELTFSCETEDVEFVYDITSSISGQGTNVALPTKTTYIITVYAKKEGYENSEVATKEIEVSGGSVSKKGDVNEDGNVNGTDIQEVINIIVNGDDEDEDNKFEKAGVRFGFYETIPGYSVKINKINITGLGVAEFGSDIIGSTIGTSTVTRTLDRADGNYTNVYLKDINEDTEMVVEVDFTMIADDGSAETINQKATTTVAPQGVTQWQPNRNYTFIYKILLTPLYMIEDSVPAICFDSVVVDGQGGMTR